MVGYPSAFVAQRLDQQCPSVSLLRDEDPTLESFRDRPIEPLCVVPVTIEPICLQIWNSCIRRAFKPSN
ncbi:unnamed protein product [Rotaria sp. Silwood2]|nr:unnamed protein product [Rotaria sp. Silwood2]CAF4632847.1 unnamed protein product [Rotaria sp. Silwood2]